MKTTIKILTLIVTTFGLYPQTANAQCYIDDWTALKAFYESTNGDNWKNNTGWQEVAGNVPASNCNLANLYGVELDAQGRVSRLNLRENELSGSIPPELGNLSKLKHLKLGKNQLSGSIPPELNNLSNLIYLDLWSNQISGSIPCELSNLHNMIRLNLFKNQLSGVIPPELGNLSKLEDLFLDDNQLYGPIPPELGNLNNLIRLYLDANQLRGVVPPELGNLDKLNSLVLRHNQLSGRIPMELGNLRNLTWLDLRYNILSGRILPELGNLNNLTLLQINNNDFSGCYSDNLVILCTQLNSIQFNEYVDISYGNNFDATWEDFCATGAGSCYQKNINVPTNYAGNVYVLLTFQNNQNILKNDYAIVYDYRTCPDHTNLENCTPVSGVDNLAANEALWTVTKAAEYFYSKYDIQIPQINIIVNSIEEPNNAYYNIENNAIILGTGDGVERNSMSAPDIVAHEYVHAIFNSINYLGNFGVPGAINESYADIFAELIELDCFGSNNWIWASQVMLGNKKGIRNLAYPKDVAMCDTMPDTYEGEHWEFINNFCFGDDNCGIHNNSGVHSYWFYLLANGGSGINDKGFNYNVNGIGIDKAVAIIMDNMVNHLNPESGLSDARTGSIEAVFKLYPNQPQVILSVIEAWNAVGVYNGRENNIKFRITNAKQIGPVIVENNKTVIPVAFDLSIDSLGMDLSADNLCFNLNLPDTYMEFFIETIYSPLSNGEISLNKNEGEVNICINRTNEGFAKKSFAPQIASNSPIVQCKICIVSADVPGDETSIIEPIGISGYTEVNTNELISFPSSFLPFCFDFDEENTPNPNRLSISLQLNNKNCQTLGALEIEVLNNPTTTPPYTYTIKNNKGTNEIISEVSNNAIYKFYNLDEGKYIVEVTDSNGKIASKKIDINFVAMQDGSICCTENLMIPPGIVSGSFNTNGAIDFSEGTYITKKGASFEVCEQISY